MNGFDEYRSAARRAVLSLGAEPVMAEDFTAGGASSRNACLDGVASADICVVILGARGGWTTPSGKVVVEEEYEEAVRRNLPISLYIQETERDPDSEALTQRLSDYVSGHFRAAFVTPDDLYHTMARHLSQMLVPLKWPVMNSKAIEDRLAEPYAIQYETTMRLVLAPERHEEIIDRLRIGEADFADEILAIGHNRDSRIFDFRASKETQLRDDVLIVEESAQSRRNSQPTTRLEISTEGIVVLDKIVSPAPSIDIFDASIGFFLLRSDIERALTAMFSYAGALFDSLDRFQRHKRFTYGVAFTGVGFRSLVDRIVKQSSYSMATTHDDVLVTEKARIVGRNALVDPTQEVARNVTLLQRKLAS